MTLPSHLGLYIHWPFCRSKCPYCDFNSHVRDAIDEQAWCLALQAQLRQAFIETEGRPLTSIFFGGGTPSLMGPSTVAAVLEEANRLWKISSATEITLEANPTSIEIANLEGYKAAGVNRLSVGVQSLREADLRFLGRHHSSLEAVAALKAAQRLFKRYSFDLIYARPNQTLASWGAELEEALSLVGDHLSVYQLTIEPGTAFHTQYQRGAFHLPDEALADDLYDLTQDMLSAHGLPAYEVSNHAKAGSACQHNLIYWRYEDYIGIGPGAHGRLTRKAGRIATQQIKSPELWLQRVLSNDFTPQSELVLDPDECVTEALMMGLRIVSGIDRAHFHRVTGVPFDEAVPQHKLNALVDEGLLIDGGASVFPTPVGIKKVNGILRYLRPHATKVS